MSELKRCKQCGILKDIKAFRPYSYTKESDNTKGQARFRLCRQCESMNTIYRRLLKERKELKTGYVATERFARLSEQLNEIEEAYKTLEAHGYSVPIQYKSREPEVSYSSKLIDFYGSASQPLITEAATELQKSSAPAPLQSIPLTPDEMDVPDDLTFWLNQSMEELKEAGFTADYLQDTVYEALRAKYRPQTGVDPLNFLPIYDDTYKMVLNQIIRKFDDYEDWVAGMEEQNESDDS